LFWYSIRIIIRWICLAIWLIIQLMIPLMVYRMMRSLVSLMRYLYIIRWILTMIYYRGRILWYLKPKRLINTYLMHVYFWSILYMTRNITILTKIIIYLIFVCIDSLYTFNLSCIPKQNTLLKFPIIIIIVLFILKLKWCNISIRIISICIIGRIKHMLWDLPILFLLWSNFVLIC
jgi:hypothetical protein